MTIRGIRLGGLGAAVCLLWAAAGTSVAAVTPPDDQASCLATTDPLVQAFQGQTALRKCAVRRLEALRLDSSATVTEVAEAGQRLAVFYQSRSGRQQAFIDTGAGVTGLGALGYALSGPAGVVTQGYWGYGALAPVLLVQFNANEPTRDIYFAGQIAVGLLHDRYALLSQRQDLDEAYPGADADILCQEAGDRLEKVATWPDGEDKTVLMPPILDLVRRCRDFTLSASRVRSIRSATSHSEGYWARAYAADLLQLHARLVERDNRLRTSPGEALGMMISTPLRKLDTLVSGEDTQKAIDAIRVQTALEGLGFTLAAFDLPPPPDRIEAPFVMPAAALDRMSRPRQHSAACVGAQATCDYLPGEAARWLYGSLGKMEAARETQNLRGQWAATVRQAAEVRELTFAYNIPSQRIDVTLRAPEAPTPGTTTSVSSPAAAR